MLNDDESTVEIERNVNVFASNLDRLMMRCGKRNATLAREIGVSRETIAVWRRGKSLPLPAHSTGIAKALRVQEADLYIVTTDDAPMLSLAQWAKRENIPITRARNLFELGILSGLETIISKTVRNGISIDEIAEMVPPDIRAPANSKHVVRLARRPTWAEIFSINLDNRMRKLGMLNRQLADATGVSQNAVTHWRSGRGYPLKERLQTIAHALDLQLDELLASPIDALAVDTWKFRFNHTKIEILEDA